jgi:flagellar biosynthesis protein FliQ
VKRRTVDLHVGLCEEHRESRKMKMVVSGGVLALSLLIGVGGAMMEAVALIVLASLMFLGGVVGLALTAGVVRAHKVEVEVAWVTAGQPFLDSL